MEIAERVKLLISKVVTTQKEFSASLDMSPARLNNYLQGYRDFPLEVLVSIAEIYKCNLIWLISGEGLMFSQAHNDTAEVHEKAPPYSSSRARTISIPCSGYISAGDPLPIISGEPICHLVLSREMVPDPTHIDCFKVCGQSMEPEIMNDDLVIIDKQFDIAALDHKICAALTGGGVTLKRLIYHNKLEATFLFPVNSNFDPLKFSWDDQDIKIIGVLKYLFRQY
jgi:SOS-response transcriptional repressor LexA